jgi:hypothetical protein
MENASDGKNVSEDASIRVSTGHDDWWRRAMPSDDREKFLVKVLASGQNWAI